MSLAITSARPQAKDLDQPNAAVGGDATHSKPSRNSRLPLFIAAGLAVVVAAVVIVIVFGYPHAVAL
jgi:hypothetical protein